MSGDEACPTLITMIDLYVAHGMTQCAGQHDAQVSTTSFIRFLAPPGIKSEHVSANLEAQPEVRAAVQKEILRPVCRFLR